MASTIFGEPPPAYERIAPTKWREIDVSAPQNPAPGLPPLGPSDADTLAALCKDSRLVREAAFSAGQAGMPLSEFLSLMELPPEAGPALKADLERGRANTMLALARVVTQGALKGDGKLLQYWLKARGGQPWQDTPQQAAQQQSQQITQIVINTGVPLPEDASARPSIAVNLSKKDYEHIPELRGTDA